MVEDSNITVYAVSNSICYKSRNYAPMTIRDSYFNYITNNYNVYLNGGLSGENNINLHLLQLKIALIMQNIKILVYIYRV